MSSDILNWILGIVSSLLLAVIGYLVKTREKVKDREFAEEDRIREEEERQKEIDKGLYGKMLDAMTHRIDMLTEELARSKDTHNQDIRKIQAKHEAEMKSMRDTVENLREKVTMLKSNMLTMSMFGADGPLAMWAKDLNGRRNWHNTQYEKMTGYKLKDCMTKTDLEITGSQVIADAWGKNDDEVIRKGIYIVTIEPCAHKDRPDDIFYVITVKWPRYVGNQIVGVDGAAHRLDGVLKAIEDSKGV